MTIWQGVIHELKKADGFLVLIESRLLSIGQMSTSFDLRVLQVICPSRKLLRARFGKVVDGFEHLTMISKIRSVFEKVGHGPNLTRGAAGDVKKGNQLL
jgi:hypothetical protein